MTRKAFIRLWPTRLGTKAIELQSEALSACVRRIHGDLVVWAGCHEASASTLQRCMVRHSVFLQQDADSLAPIAGFESQLSARMESLPFKSGALDGLVLHHALELVEDPRVALREATRVLAPGGRLVICGFNPMSLMGLRRLYAGWVADSLSSHQTINPIRLFDWLTLLGYELEAKPVYCGYGLQFKTLVERLDYRWLRNLDGWLDRTLSRLLPILPFGSMVIVSAVKQAVPMKPQRFTKSTRRRLAPVAYPRASQWQRNKP